MDGRWAFLCMVAWASVASADTISLKDHRELLEAQIVDETDAAFVIEVPKAQVTRIERSAPFTKRSTVAAPQVLWEERDGYLIIQIPQQQVERRSVAASPAPSSLGVSLAPPQADVASKVATSAPILPLAQADQRLGSITGRVLWDSKPLANCKMKMIMVSSPQPLAMVSKLLGHTEAHADENGFVAEAVTDASGRYHVAQVPPGEYDIYWQPSGQPDSQWIRRLREKPDLVVLEGESATYPDIEAHVKTRN